MNTNRALERYILLHNACMRITRFGLSSYRSIEGVFSEEVRDSHGFTLWRYTSPDSYVANATVNPDNIGFCTPNCLDKGLFNMSNCQISE